MNIEDKIVIDLTNTKIDENLSFKNNLILKLKCIKCGEDYITTFYNLKKDFICKCKLCKRKETCIEKYGVDNPSKSEAIKEKTKQNNLKKWGFVSTAQNPDVQAKAKQTRLKNGTTQESSEIREKTKKTWQNKSKEEVVDIVRRRKETSLKRFGVDVPSKAQIVKDITKKHNLEKYNCEYPSQLESVKEKIKQTNLKRYGVENWFSSNQMQVTKKTKYFFDNQSFDSSVELVFYIYYKEHNLYVKRNTIGFQYKTLDGEKHIYYPDFEIENQLIEIKGNQFLKEDGSWRNPNDSSLDELYEAKHQCALKNNVTILYSKDCQKYFEYVHQKYGRDYIKQFKLKKGEK